MNRPGSLWRVVRPLEEGASAGWMRLYYDHMYQMAFHARTVEDVAKIAIAHAHATFRSEVVAVALLDGDAWNVLPYRQNDTTAEPLRIPLSADGTDPQYEPGQVVDVPDLPLFAEHFPRFAPLADRGIRSLVAAAFGSLVHGRGYLALASYAPHHYSDDEYVLMCLHALAAGIGFDHAGAAGATGATGV
jgi:hypothetical protein